jgi:hypothetical protein
MGGAKSKQRQQQRRNLWQRAIGFFIQFHARRTERKRRVKHSDLVNRAKTWLPDPYFGTLPGDSVRQDVSSKDKQKGIDTLSALPELTEEEIEQIYYSEFLGNLKQAGFLPREGWTWGNWSDSQWKIALTWGQVRGVIMSDYRQDYEQRRSEYEANPLKWQRLAKRRADVPPPVTEIERQQKELESLAFQQHLAAFFESQN